MNAERTLTLIKRTLANKVEDVFEEERERIEKSGIGTLEIDRKKDTLLKLLGTLAEIESREEANG